MSNKQKVLIEVEVADFKDGAILVFNSKKKTFETKSVDELIEKFISGIKEYVDKLESSLIINTETYKTQLERLANVITGIENVLGGNKQ